MLEEDILQVVSQAEHQAWETTGEAVEQRRACVFVCTLWITQRSERPPKGVLYPARIRCHGNIVASVRALRSTNRIPQSPPCTALNGTPCATVDGGPLTKWVVCPLCCSSQLSVVPMLVAVSDLTCRIGTTFPPPATTVSAASLCPPHRSLQRTFASFFLTGATLPDPASSLRATATATRGDEWRVQQPCCSSSARTQSPPLWQKFWTIHAAPPSNRCLVHP